MDHIRAAGLRAAYQQQWSIALVYLSRAVRAGAFDLETLDALAQAAYKSHTPEALGPFQNHYKYPALAAQMARAFLMLGDLPSTHEFLGYASESGLKAGVKALAELSFDVERAAENFLRVAREYNDLDFPEFWRTLAAVADSVGDEAATRLAERRSQGRAYSDPNIHFNQALRMLGKKEFRAGWRLFEFRLVPGTRNPNRMELGRIRHWEGENISGKRILVYFEQGLGDVIFSARYLLSLMERGAQVEAAVPRSLISLLEHSFPRAKVHDQAEAIKEEYWEERSKPHFWVYSMSIPARAGIYEPVNTAKYLDVPPSLQIEVKNRLKELNPTNLPVFAINWRGRVDTEADRTRAYSALELGQCSGVLREPCFVISVQKDAQDAELNQLQKVVQTTGGKLFNAAPLLQDFAHTGAWIRSSQHLFTCDTSVAHLGGALGHPTTVMARNTAIWQWTIREGCTPLPTPRQATWYDSVDVQAMLAPKVSWLCAIGDVSVKPHTKNSSIDSVPNESISRDQKNFAVRPGELSSSRFRKTFHIAGRRPSPNVGSVAAPPVDR